MSVDDIELGLQKDVEAIQQIPIVASLLNVICRTTGMRFAAVARVTEDRWITCGIQDEINFGLTPGSELKIETTICNEIRQSQEPVVIDHVAEDAVYCKHHTPALYGFESYISVPIFRKDGSFFGTLCAIDPKPAKLSNSATVGMFNLFADLISFHLNAVEALRTSEMNLEKEREERTRALEQKNAELQKMNVELESFAHVASHDLQEPLRKIKTFSHLIFEKDYHNLSDGGKQYYDRLEKSVNRMQTLIKDLIMYTQVKEHEQVFELTPLGDMIEDVKHDYEEDIIEKKAMIEVGTLCNAFVIPFQFKQLLHNLIGNSLKFSKPGVAPVIKISSVIEKGSGDLPAGLLNETYYCHISISDNGIGFDPSHSEQIFKVFQRLNGRTEYDGTGIGLSIVKKIVDNHNGVITATGELGKGANFDIYLPQPVDHPQVEERILQVN
jgi:signal transduction histidine kinase